MNAVVDETGTAETPPAGQVAIPPEGETLAPPVGETVKIKGSCRSEEIGLLASALALAQGEFRPAIKDSENPHFKSSYADLASVWNACRGPLAKNGLSIVQVVKHRGEGDKITVVTELLHTSGQFIRGSLTLRCPQVTPQGIGSGFTYGRRYGLAALLGIAPDEDDDGEAAMGRGKNKGKGQDAPATAPAPSEEDRKKEAVRAIEAKRRFIFGSDQAWKSWLGGRVVSKMSLEELTLLWTDLKGIKPKEESESPAPAPAEAPEEENPQGRCYAALTAAAEEKFSAEPDPGAAFRHWLKGQGVDWRTASTLPPEKLNNLTSKVAAYKVDRGKLRSAIFARAQELGLPEDCLYGWVAGQYGWPVDPEKKRASFGLASSPQIQAALKGLQALSPEKAEAMTQDWNEYLDDQARIGAAEEVAPDAAG